MTHPAGPRKRHPQSSHERNAYGLGHRRIGLIAGPVGNIAAELTNQAQLDRVRYLTEDAIERGAVAVAGGHALPRPGYFFAPTVLRDATDGMPVVDEEQFGPVIPVIAFDDVDAVIEQVNSSSFGLTASVWSADVDHAARRAARIEAGQVSVTAHGSGFRPTIPFSGHKHSGIGSENGLEVISEYTSTTVVIRPKN